MGKISVLSLSLVLLLVFSAPAASHEIEPEEAGHPLRVTAYILHPVGYVLYHGVIRPAHFFISLPGMSQVFGHSEDVSHEESWESSAHWSPSARGYADTEPELDEDLDRASRSQAEEE